MIDVFGAYITVSVVTVIFLTFAESSANKVIGVGLFWPVALLIYGIKGLAEIWDD